VSNAGFVEIHSSQLSVPFWRFLWLVVPLLTVLNLAERP